MAQEQLVLSIPTASDKLRQYFPEDPKADIQIQFKKRVFKLIKAHLRLQSNYFKRNLTVDRSILEINEDFDPNFFSNVLECLYGASLKVHRSHVLDYFPIVQFLEIECLINELKQDIVQHTSEYNFFKVFDSSYRYSDQQIFQKCLLELEYRDYIQIKQEKQELLGITQQLFKLIIKSHNRLPKEKRPLNAYQINHLIIEYCDYNNLQAVHRNSLKFEMIDKNNLNSHEYRDIFINDGAKTHGSNARKFPARALSLNPMRGAGNHLHPQSLSSTTNLNLFHVTHKNLYLEMDTTFLKKISNELHQQKQKLIQQIQSLTDATKVQNQKSKLTKKQFDLISKKLSDRPNQKVISQKIKSIDNNLSEFEKSMSSQSQRLQSLFNSTNDLLQKYEKQQKQLSMSESSCNSSMWNVTNDKNQKTKDFVAIKNQNKSIANKSNTSFVSKSESQIREKERDKANISIAVLQNQNKKDKQNIKFYLKQTRLQFSKEPFIFKNFRQLETLANLINPERFTKKKLKLLYRGQKGQKKNYLKASDEATKKLRVELQYKNNILFLFRTDFDKLIGGFASETLDFNQLGDCSDQQAFIFTVTEGKKFKVKPEQKNEAIQINDGYLICFGTDLMISENMYEAENYCAWPSTYEGNSDKKQRKSDWFVEDSQFAIKQMECYEVKDEGGDIMAI